MLALAGGAAWLIGLGGPAERNGHGRARPGIAVTVWLMMRASRAGGSARGARLDRDRRRRVIYLLVVGAGLVAVGGTLLRATGRAELTAPLTVAVCGALLLPLARCSTARPARGRRGADAAGCGWAVLALNSAGTTESQGLVGLVAGRAAVGGRCAAGRVADELRERIRR